MASSMTISSVNPATGAIVETIRLHTPNEVDDRLASSASAFALWRTTALKERIAMLERVSASLDRRKEELALLMASEMGKPLGQGKSEIEKCSWVCRYYAENAEELLARKFVTTDVSSSYICYSPIGVLLAIMPWNFPFWQVFRVAAPNLLLGNTLILKHALNVPGCARAIESVFDDAGLAPGCFTTVFVRNDDVAKIISDGRVSGVTLTGSTRAGKAVAAVAGKHLKKTVLELGGSDPYIVLADAELQSAVEACITSRLINSGQSCIAAKRFIVVKNVSQEFTEMCCAMMREKVVGSPLVESTDVGPLARDDLRVILHKQVEASREAGAKVLLGGSIQGGPGFFYPCTVLADVVPGMPAFDEELFGPVASIIVARDTRHALDLANSNVYGLGGALFTGDVEAGKQLAELRLDVGSCAINTYVRSDPRLPFGGIKQSGYGRELGVEGIREFANVKTVLVG